MSGEEAWLLALDTATSRVVVAAGDRVGRLVAERTVPAEHRHGERLLAAVQALMVEVGLELATLAGIIVGTGPGAFTGLRAGIATAKTLAHELDLPIAGVSTAEALLAAAGATVLLLPAGPHDRVEVRPGRPPLLLAGGTAPDLAASDVAVAVDLADRAPGPARERGVVALDGLGAALLRLGSDRLADGSDDPATLVPEYVTLPRGAVSAPDDGGVSWSHDRR